MAFTPSQRFFIPAQLALLAVIAAIAAAVGVWSAAGWRHAMVILLGIVFVSFVVQFALAVYCAARLHRGFPDALSFRDKYIQLFRSFTDPVEQTLAGVSDAGFKTAFEKEGKTFRWISNALAIGTVILMLIIMAEYR